MEKAFSWNGIILYPFWAKMPMFSLAFNLYQENGNVLDQAVINLGASDLDTYAKDLTQLFGEPTETH